MTIGTFEDLIRSRTVVLQHVTAEVFFFIFFIFSHLILSFEMFADIGMKYLYSPDCLGETRRILSFLGAHDLSLRLFSSPLFSARKPKDGISLTFTPIIYSLGILIFLI